MTLVLCFINTPTDSPKSSDETMPYAEPISFYVLARKAAMGRLNISLR